jgi:hypothetical protein
VEIKAYVYQITLETCSPVIELGLFDCDDGGTLCPTVMNGPNVRSVARSAAYNVWLSYFLGRVSSTGRAMYFLAMMYTKLYPG